MPTIRETVELSLRAMGRGDYITYAQSVVTALEDREREMTSKLLDAAEDYDMDRGDVYQELRELGFVVPADQADEAPVDKDRNDDLLDRFERLTRHVESLTQFARSKGYGG